MKYNLLGNTGLKVSRLGFGCMRFPMKGLLPDKAQTLRMLEKGFELGINYFDTAPLYCSMMSENIVGKFIQGKRDKVILSTKDMGRSLWTFERSFERSLKKLKTDYIDVFHFWSMDLEAFKKVTAAEGLLDFAYKMKKDGKVRHFAFSFHDAEPDNVKEVIDSGLFESMLLSYNVLNRVNEKWLEYGKAKGLGTAIMNPVAGGALASSDSAAENTDNARIALKHVLGKGFIDIALSGMSSEAQVVENCAAASGDYAFTPEEQQGYENICAKYNSLLRLYCTACNYCKGCPAGIDIPGVFGIYNGSKVKWQGLAGAKSDYAKVKNKADRCTACGACMKKCPQKLDIISNLRECHKTLNS